MIRPSPISTPRRLTTRGALVLCGVFASCGQAILIAPSGSSLSIFVNPSFIAANGDSAVVSVLILEPAGTPVPDGTVVQFFTTLGKIPEQGKTNDGVARVNFVSDARSGTATITAVSGGAVATTGGTGGTGGTGTRGTVDVIIGAPRVSSVRPFAIDPSINLARGQTIARFGVTVSDDKGNPISGVAVRFSVTSDVALDRLLDNPLSVFTDNSGEATGRVQTTRTEPGNIKIRIEVLAPGAPAISPELTIPVIQVK